MPGCDGAEMAEWSYPSLRSGRRPGEATPRSRSVVAGRRHLTSKVRGGDPEEPPQARGKGQQLREAPEEQWVRRHRRA